MYSGRYSPQDSRALTLRSRGLLPAWQSTVDAALFTVRVGEIELDFPGVAPKVESASGRECIPAAAKASHTTDKPAA
jgi:hypothetical protein